MDTQGLTLLLDVSHRGCEDVLPIGDELQLAAELLFPAFRVNIRDDSRSLNRRVDTTEDNVCSAADAVGRNIQSFLTIVLGRYAHSRYLIYVFTEATGLHYLRQYRQNAGIVDTTAKMKHRWDAYRLTNLRQTRPGVLEHLRGQVSVLTRSVSGTPRHQNKHIILDELLRQVDDAFAVGGACIVTTHDGSRTLDLSVDDILVEGDKTLTISPTQHVAKVLVRETRHYFVLEAGNTCFTPVLIIINRLLDDFFGDLQRALFLELHVQSALDFGLGRGGHNMRMVVLGNLHQTLEHALDIRHHQFHGPGQECQLLV